MAYLCTNVQTVISYAVRSFLRRSASRAFLLRPPLLVYNTLGMCIISWLCGLCRREKHTATTTTIFNSAFDLSHSVRAPARWLRIHVTVYVHVVYTVTVHIAIQIRADTGQPRMMNDK